MPPGGAVDVSLSSDQAATEQPTFMLWPYRTETGGSLFRWSHSGEGGLVSVRRYSPLPGELVPVVVWW